MTTLSRRDFLGVITAAMASAQASAIGREQPPNILFILTDDHAQQAISAYGSVINETPNIDRIACEGAIFARNSCGNSICAPSRASVLTGKHSHANGQRTNQDVFDGAQTTFPKLLHEAGYDTSLIGKWHLRSEPTGFNHHDILIGQGNYYNPDFVGPAGKRRIEGYVTDIITDLALAWLDRRRGRAEPFLLMCQHKAPHRTWVPGPDHLTLYDDVTIPEPPTLFDDYAHRAPVLARNEASIARHLMYDYDLKVPGLGIPDALGRDMVNDEVPRMTPEQRAAWDAAYGPIRDDFLKNRPEGAGLIRWKYQRYIKDYLRCVASVDDNVGRMLAYLEENRLASNTIVVYCSDQGFYLGEHGLYDKRWMYRESLAMPLVLRWPDRVKAGTRVERLTQNIDFAPTFLEAAGLAPPPDLHGRSLLPLLREERPEGWRDAIYYHYYETGEHNVPRHEGVSTERYKLIHYYDEGLWELYDLEKDPQEMRSVYDDPPFAAVVTAMKQKLEELKVLYAVPPEDFAPAAGTSP
ncbi:MAG: sulfatase [Candidatus Hydrogenedentes bacterium]|nr:sulfatase [Candidatus Hydrogenedentota bacterium]